MKKKKVISCLIAGAILVSSVLVLGGCGKDKKEKFDWSEVVLSDKLPEPPSDEGKVWDNSDEKLWIDMDNVSDKQYNDYLQSCIEKGYTTDADKDNGSYKAYNSEGYCLSLRHTSSLEDLNLELEAPMELGSITWPSSTVGKLLPAPKSTTGKFMQEQDKCISAYVGDTSKDDYDKYVSACSDKGFNVDYDKDDKYYNAYNKDGWYLQLAYEGNKIMRIDISMSEEDEDSDGYSDDSSEDESSEIETEKPTEKKTEPPVSSESSDDSNEGVLANVVSPDFKETMDSYEAFFDEYIDFMKRYSDNPSDLSMLSEYTEWLTKYSDYMDKMYEIDSDSLSTADYLYYLEVTKRITDKLAEIGE